MKMNDIDFKALTIGLAVCFSIGGVIDYFTAFHWLPAGFFVMFAIFFNGVIISIEDRQPGGWDHVGNNNPIPDAQFKKMLLVQKLCTLLALILGFVTYAYTSN
jgi:hypothetical protein